MNIYFYQAECGDAARIEYKGNDGKIHNIFIDSGFERTYRDVFSQHIYSLARGNLVIDLWVVSHIHDDHIGGVIKYLKSIHNGEVADIVQKWFYNPPRFSFGKLSKLEKEVSSSKSIGQGDALLEYLSNINNLNSKDILSGQVEDYYGLKISVLSPSIDKLNDLRGKYDISKSIPFEREENEKISIAVKSRKNDYHIKLDSFDLDKWEEDDSIENGSSISILTEYLDKKILWLADAHPTDVVKSLKEKGYSSKNRLKCQWVKVAHHGSEGNNSNELYSLIDCNNYLYSVNGQNKHSLPSKESFARIIRNDHRLKNSHYKFYFTHDNETLRSIFEIDSDNIFREWNFEVKYLSTDMFWEFSI